MLSNTEGSPEEHNASLRNPCSAYGREKELKGGGGDG